MPSPAAVLRHLKDVEYPATKDDLLAAAEEVDAPEEVLEALEELEDTTFEGPDEVAEALGEEE